MSWKHFFINTNTNMKKNELPDVTLNCILCRLQLPIELRFIVSENYFPFLPNESKKMTRNDLLDLVNDKTIPDLRISILVRNEIKYIIGRTSGLLMLMIRKIRDPISKEEQIIIETRQNHLTFLPPEEGKMTIPTKEITEQTVDEKVDFILKWYRHNLILYSIAYLHTIN